MNMAKKAQMTLAESIKKLEAISDWFDKQKEIDLEKGLEKVKEGADGIAAEHAPWQCDCQDCDNESREECAPVPRCGESKREEQAHLRFVGEKAKE